jgi:predicted Zn-dependent protease with MMP-like domain
MTSGRRDRLAVYRDIQHRFRPDRQQFEQLVREALEALPGDIKKRVENVAIVIEEDSRTGRECESLLGLYEGIALPYRGDGYHLAPPDRITVFRRPILAAASTREEVLREIRETVVHEIGHFFGVPERELP